MANDRPKLELSAPQVIGGALAAASAAVASSWLGVAGTVLGAVIVSLVASIGSTLYTHSLERSSRKIRETLPVVPLRSATAFTTRVARDPQHSAAHDTTLPMPAVGDPSDEGGTVAAEQTQAFETPARPGRSPLQWRTVAVTALASLALAAAVLTGFETFVGKPVSAITGANDDGGTTVSQLVGHDSSPSRSTDPGGGSSNVDPNDSSSTPGDQGAPSGTDAPQDSPQPSPDDSAGTPSGGSSSPGPTTPTPTGSTPTAPTEPTPTSATATG